VDVTYACGHVDSSAVHVRSFEKEGVRDILEMRGSFVEIQGSFARYRALVGGKRARSQSYVGYSIDAFMSYSVRAHVPSGRERVCDMTHPGCVSRVMSHM